MINHDLKMRFAQDVSLLSYVGIKPIIVHGGGPQIGELLKKIGKESIFVQGLRVTDEETMDYVEMVLVAKVNKDIVSLINQVGGRAVGLSGRDGRLITAKKAQIGSLAHEDADLGLVGEVDRIEPEVITSLENMGFTPVIAPVGAGPDGKPYNINADSAAGALCAHLGAEKFVLLTDTPGVVGEDGEIISSLNEDHAEELIRSGLISGGMIPKVRCCISALAGGAPKAHIVDGRTPHAVLLEILTQSGVGTEIVRMKAPGL
jgi:acetylglutamate kinase